MAVNDGLVQSVTNFKAIRIIEKYLVSVKPCTYILEYPLHILYNGRL